MGFFDTLYKGIKDLNDYANEMRDDINKWYDEYQYKNDDELKDIVRYDSDKTKKVAANKILKERGY